jgi:hypothetical protein
MKLTTDSSLGSFSSRELAKFAVGDRVKHADIYHVRGASVGAIESITERGWFQVWWETDGDSQIHPAARTYEGYELELLEENHERD